MAFLLFLLLVVASVALFFLIQMAKNVREIATRGIPAVERSHPVEVTVATPTKLQTADGFRIFSHQHQAAAPDDEWFIVWRWTDGVWRPIDNPRGADTARGPSHRGRFDGEMTRTFIS